MNHFENAANDDEISDNGEQIYVLPFKRWAAKLPKKTP
jgi:hypothetical protein